MVHEESRRRVFKMDSRKRRKMYAMRNEEESNLFSFLGSATQGNSIRPEKLCRSMLDALSQVPLGERETGCVYGLHVDLARKEGVRESQEKSTDKLPIIKRDNRLYETTKSTMTYQTSDLHISDDMKYPGVYLFKDCDCGKGSYHIGEKKEVEKMIEDLQEILKEV